MRAARLTTQPPSFSLSSNPNLLRSVLVKVKDLGPSLFRTLGLLSVPAAAVSSLSKGEGVATRVTGSVVQESEAAPKPKARVKSKAKAKKEAVAASQKITSLLQIMGKPSSGKEASVTTPDKGKTGKPVSKEGKGKSKPWSAYGNRRQLQAPKRDQSLQGPQKVLRSTVAKSRDRPGKAERRLALYNKGEEVDPTPSQFPVLPNNFNPDLPPKRRKTRTRGGGSPLLRKERRGLATPTTPNRRRQKSRPHLQPRDPPFASRRGQEQAPEPPQERVKEEVPQDPAEKSTQLLEVLGLLSGSHPGRVHSLATQKDQKGVGNLAR